MHPTGVGIVVFSFTFGGALVGMRLRTALPAHHLDDETRETVKVGIGLIATMTALVLGLVTASAKSAFDGLDTTVKHTAADLLSLDRTLARYGPETREIRASLEDSVGRRIEEVWPHGRSVSAQLDPSESAHRVEQLAEAIRRLEPTTREQRWLQERALNLAETLLDTRWLVFSGLSSSIPVPFLSILLFWLTVTFASFGLFAPRNATAITLLLVCALSVAGAVFLVLELDGPFDGLITVSPEPMKYALAHLGQ